MPQAAATATRTTKPTPGMNAKPGMVLVGAPIELKAAQDGALPSKFSGVAYSGGYVPDYEVVIDLATTTFRQRMPLLDTHWRSDILGVIEAAAIKDFRMEVAGRIFSDMTGSNAEKIANLAQRGVPYEMSVGLFAFTREFVPAGKAVHVNGQTFNGPVNVLRNGQVREVSIVTLGADPRTDTQFFDQPTGADTMTDPNALAIQVAELQAQIGGHAAALAAAHTDGATAERTRIQHVLAQSMPGHETLLNALAFDGKTTGPEAAVAVLNAERTLRGTAAVNLALDAPKPAKPAATPSDDAAAAAAAAALQAEAALPLEERCKAQWTRDPKVRAEFANQGDFMAYTKANEAGRLRVLSTRTA